MKRRLKIIVEIESSERLRNNLAQFIKDNSLSPIQGSILYEAIKDGAIMESIRRGYAETTEIGPNET